MSLQGRDRFSLTESLALAEASMQGVVQAMGSARRVDIAGLPEGAAALLCVRAEKAHGRPMVLLTPDHAVALRTAANLHFFLGSEAEDSAEAGQVLVYPGMETTPFLDVATDRRAGMERLAVLFHLAQALPWRFLVLPAAAAIERVPPGQAIARRSTRIRAGREVDRDALLALLADSGYLRVPVVEDPGSFASRGSLIDVFPPRARHPARIELDDELVVSIRLFDPQDQRTLSAVPELWIHPAKEVLLGSQDLALAQQRISDVCDQVNLPSRRRRQLFDDIQSGRLFFGMKRFVPAFYPQLEQLFEYLPSDVSHVIVDPAGVVRAVRQELSRAKRDREARFADRVPVFEVEAHYISEQQLADRLVGKPLTAIHTLAIGGQPEEDQGGPLAHLETADPHTCMRVAAQDQRALASALRAQREGRSGDEPLTPLVMRIRAWLDEGLKVLLTARTRSQAERLASLLRTYELPVARKRAAFDPGELTALPAGKVQVVVGELASGFLLPTEALACVTEEEVFGERRRLGRTQQQRRDKARTVLEDLQQLEVGDYVVHLEHGIGRYLGLERKVVPLSRAEQLHGLTPISVEVLTLEYADGDKLFVPVTRLNQIGKFAGSQSAKPKLDRLGGQTFSRTKSRVRGAVRQLADDLLALYAARTALKRQPLRPPDRSFAEFEAAFAYEETPDQSRAIDEVLTDLQGTRPMDRLVCGDVGFGKTEVALRAAFRTAWSGRQVALLCPTTVLAQQHFLTFQDRLRPYPLIVHMLSRFVPKKAQAEIVAALKAGTCDIVVGTHRLLSKDVHFKSLGLLVVDEEQRFGVADKERIKKLKTEVDVLTLSATPIPRTMHMAVGGLRDLSVIATPPTDRRAVRTFVTRWDDHVIREAVDRELARGGQVFFVHNRIEGIFERARRLQQLVPEARVAVAHGRMREAGLEKVMTDFVGGHYDVLCATAIVENGLDIPRVNTILIDRADTFGLSQLYQLRGRVGRSSERAYCYLIAPPARQMTDEARTRIQALERFSQLGSGFQLASLDMELRGAGDLLGAEQSGNLAAVGLNLFIQMLEEAVAELRGESIEHEVDPELTLNFEHFLPEDYVADVGIRLSLYRRFAVAEDENAIAELAAEMEDRFGPPPEPARHFVRAMFLKPALRRLKVLGCEASSERVRFHFRSDAPLDPEKVLRQVSTSADWQLTPDMKLTRRYHDADVPAADAVDRIQTLLRELGPLARR